MQPKPVVFLLRSWNIKWCSLIQANLSRVWRLSSLSQSNPLVNATLLIKQWMSNCPTLFICKWSRKSDLSMAAGEWDTAKFRSSASPRKCSKSPYLPLPATGDIHHTVDGCEILNHLGWLKPYIHNGINHISIGAGFHNHPLYLQLNVGY